MATALKEVYRAADAVAAAAALTEFADGPWGRKHPAITAAWRRNWEQVIPFRLPAGGASDDLHHQRHREPEQHAASLGSYSRALPERRSGDEADLAAVARGDKELEDAGTRVAHGEGAVRFVVR